MPDVSKPSGMSLTQHSSNLEVVPKPSFNNHSVSGAAAKGSRVEKSKASGVPGSVKPGDLNSLVNRDMKLGTGAQALVQLAGELSQQAGISSASNAFQEHFQRNANEALGLLTAGHFTKNLGEDAHKDPKILGSILNNVQINGEGGSSLASQVASVDSLLTLVDNSITLGSPALFDTLGGVINKLSDSGADVSGVTEKMKRSILEYDKANPNSGLKKDELHKLMNELSKIEKHEDEEHVDVDEKEKVEKEKERAEVNEAMRNAMEDASEEDIPVLVGLYDAGGVGVVAVVNPAIPDGDGVDMRSLSNASDLRSAVQSATDLYNDVLNGTVSEDNLRSLADGGYTTREEILEMLQGNIAGMAQVAVDDINQNGVDSSQGSLWDANLFCQLLADSSDNPGVKSYVDAFLDKLVNGDTDAQQVASWIQDVMETIKANELDGLVTSVFDLVASPESNVSFMYFMQEAFDINVNRKYDLSEELKNQIRTAMDNAEGRGLSVRRREGDE
jgi:hypothetical protein